MESFFLNPGLVGPGAALVSAPIIIHLINRLRYRRVRFAAMEFLLQSQQKNRRRILIEQLILLLLRILIVLAIMFLIARFFLSPSQLSVITGQAASHHVILVDDSGSMREIVGKDDEGKDVSAFQRAKVIVRRLVAKASKEPGRQRITILALSKPDKPLFRDADADDDLLKRVQTSLENLGCTRRRLDLTDGIKAAGKILLDEGESRTAIKLLHVVSDVRLEDWKSSQSALVTTVESLTKAKVTVNLLRTVKQGKANVAVSRLDGEVHTAAADVELEVTIGVTNFGTQPRNNVPVRLWADGKRLPKVVVFDRVEPGREALQSTEVTFESAGAHQLRAELVQPDSLDSDNKRYMAVEKLPKFNKVLLIDGDPTGKDADFVAAALASENSGTGIQVERHDPDWLRRNPLEPFQCIYMLNVAQVDADAMAPLEKYVREGGGLAWFVGNLVNADFYNRKLYQTDVKKDENGKVESRRVTGLFPVPLFTTAEDLPIRDPGETVPDVVVPGKPEIFKELLEIAEGKLLGLLSLKRYWPVSPTLPGAGGGTWDKNDNKRKDGVATIARLRNGQPLMFQHRHGQGRIVTCLTTAGRGWNDWAAASIYTVIQLKIRQAIARRTLDRQRLVGEPIDENLPGTTYTETGTIAAPEAEPIPLRASPVTVKADASKKAKSKSDDELAYRVVYNETDQPGVYAMKLSRIKGAEKLETRMYAYNVPLEESATELVQTKAIEGKFPKNDRMKVFDFGSETPFEGELPGQEILKFLIALLVVLLLVEQTLAYIFSYHTRDA